jgi:hypothetical protein
VVVHELRFAMQNVLDQLPVAAEMIRL